MGWLLSIINILHTEMMKFVFSRAASPWGPTWLYPHVSPSSVRARTGTDQSATVLPAMRNVMAPGREATMCSIRASVSYGTVPRKCSGTLWMPSLRKGHCVLLNGCFKCYFLKLLIGLRLNFTEMILEWVVVYILSRWRAKKEVLKVQIKKTQIIFFV